MSHFTLPTKMDHPIAEIFANQGETVFTVFWEPIRRLKELSLHNKNGRVSLNNLEMWGLENMTTDSTDFDQEIS